MVGLECHAREMRWGYCVCPIMSPLVIGCRLDGVLLSSIEQAWCALGSIGLSYVDYSFIWPESYR